MKKKALKLNATPALTEPATPKLKITDAKQKKHLGILLVPADTMSEVTKKSGKLATHNEYQVHYWFLNVRYKLSDDSIVDIALPTVMFNYEQSVSSAAVEFDLTKVEETSQAVEPLHNVEINKILNDQDFGIAIRKATKLFGVEPEFISMPFGTIHRHPGNLLSFSGTDLAKTSDNPGICYPFGEIPEDDIPFKPSFSSIMIHKGGKTMLGHTEYRTASRGDNTVAYKQNPAICMVDEKATKPSLVAALLGAKAQERAYNTTSLIDDKAELNNELIEVIRAIKDARAAFPVNTQFINPDNVTQQARYTAPRYMGARKTPLLDAASKTTRTTTVVSEVPHRSTERYKKVAKAILEMHDVPLYSRAALNALSAAQRITYHGTLHEVYFGRPPAKGTKDIDEIIELQDEIWLEEEESINDLEGNWLNDTPEEESDDSIANLLHVTDAEMRKELISWGMLPQTVQDFSEAQVKHYWESAVADI